MHRLLRPFVDLKRIFFPDTCRHCGTLLVGDERGLCTDCMGGIAWLDGSVAEATGYNNVEERLAGLVPLVRGAALMVFRKGSVVQSIVHEIKYYHNTTMAKQFGRLLGEMLRDTGRYKDIDLIVPVPLHWYKQMKRGYNQSHFLCEGISQVLQKPVERRNLYRRKYTESQTHKNWTERQNNMQGVFAVRHPERLSGKHLLLVDDILTTGATTTACYDALKDIEGLKISVAVLAVVDG